MMRHIPPQTNQPQHEQYQPPYPQHQQPPQQQLPHLQHHLHHQQQQQHPQYQYAYPHPQTQTAIGAPPPAPPPAPQKRVPAPGEAEGVVVRTKFPVARIKRIVQADEDVGKVAQVTPVVVSKALELFMISLTLKAAALATSRGSKRVTGAHLKAAVLQDEQFDFLSDIVEKIPDAPAPKEKGSSS